MIAATSLRLPTSGSLQDRGFCPGIGGSSPRARTSDFAYLQLGCRAPKCAATKARAILAIDLLQAQVVCPQALEQLPAELNEARTNLAQRRPVVRAEVRDRLVIAGEMVEVMRGFSPRQSSRATSRSLLMLTTCHVSAAKTTLRKLTLVYYYSIPCPWHWAGTTNDGGGAFDNRACAAVARRE